MCVKYGVVQCRNENRLQMYGKRALREVGWRRRLKILLKEELRNLYSAKSKLEGWKGRKM